MNTDTQEDPQAASNCAICSNKMTFSFANDEAKYYVCDTCGYLVPVIQDLDSRELNDEIYSESFDQNLDVAAVVTSKRRRKYTQFLARVEGYRKTNRLLDIGCGGGRLLQVAAEKDWDAYGVDPAMKNLSQETREGVTVIPKLLHEAGFEPDFFDVVHANELFEHVDDPLGLVRDILNVLRPGGVLVFRTPNHDSWTKKAVGTHWRELGVLRKGHVGFFSPRTARRMLTDMGFDKVKIETHHFSMRDRWSVKTPVVGNLMRLGYRGLGQVAKLCGTGERMTVYGQVGSR